LTYSQKGQSEESARKSAGRDLANQKLLRSLEIAGLGTILCAIVDYRGTRYVGQSIIPGIFVQGEQRATLLYGVLERGKAATVKHTSLQLFEQLAQKLFLAKRAIPVIPFPADAPVTEADEESNGDEDRHGRPEDALAALLKSAELSSSSSSSSSPIKVDETDNVPVDAATHTVSHIGPIEAKLIQGTDGRTYALELMRLTPRDANYVPQTRGGSAVLVAERLQSLAEKDESVLQTYVLRQELVRIFLLRKVNLQRQALLNELAGKEKEVMSNNSNSAAAALENDVTDAKESTATTAVIEDVSDDDEEEEGQRQVQIVKKDEAAEKAEKEAIALDEHLASEYREKFSAITVESLGVEINANVFLPSLLIADCEKDRLAQDESLVREMSVFLYESVLPMLTRQVREGDVSPKDCDSLCALLHRMGVNLRYLGRLADLAMEQEREDAELMFQNKQRVHSMPYFWLELLEIELLSRAAKHMLNAAMKADPLVASAPAATVAALLNRFLQLLCDPARARDAAAATAVEAVEDKKKSDNNNNNKSTKKTHKKAANSSHSSSSSSAATQQLFSAAELSLTPPLPESLASQDSFSATLQSVLFDKFLHETPLLAAAAVKEEEESSAENKEKDEAEEKEKDRRAWQSMHASLLRSRLSPLTLIRRICQQCGVVLAAKSYDFSFLREKDVEEDSGNNSHQKSKAPKKKDSSSPSAEIVSAADVLCLQPKVKSCEPETYLASLPEMLSSSSTLLSQGNAVAAFEVAQQALNIVSQITGPTHLHALQATEQLTNVLVNSADLKSGAQMTTRTLALASQVQGLDHQGVVFQHVQLAMLETEMGNYAKAFDHLATAK
jgi:hypothetical protein